MRTAMLKECVIKNYEQKVFYYLFTYVCMYIVCIIYYIYI